jgi:hypothetical protein
MKGRVHRLRRHARDPGRNTNVRHSTFDDRTSSARRPISPRRHGVFASAALYVVGEQR